ncbi:hypothetical protein EJB05_25071, partial [Eragrostis curvula]
MVAFPSSLHRLRRPHPPHLAHPACPRRRQPDGQPILVSATPNGQPEGAAPYGQPILAGATLDNQPAAAAAAGDHYGPCGGIAKRRSDSENNTKRHRSRDPHVTHLALSETPRDCLATAAMECGEFCCVAWMLVITNALFLGGAASLVFMLARLARAHDTSGIIAVSVFLVFWVGIGSMIYCAFCSGLGVGSMAHARVVAPPTTLPWRDRRPRRLPSVSGGGTAGDRWPQHVVEVDRPGLEMDTLPREPPVRDWDVAVDIPVYEQPDDDAASKCPVCLNDVKEGEVVKQLPLCRHLFHQQCIDQWLRDKPTCPVCRSGVFATLPDGMV